MSKQNFPPQQIDNIDPDFVVDTIDKVMLLSRMNELGKPESNEALKQRINDYFCWCRDCGVRPGVEGISTALGIHRSTFYRWSKGIDCDQERFEIVRSAKGLIDTYLEICATSGKLNPPVAIFLMKNYLGYEDSLTIEARTNAEAENSNRTTNVQTIADKYIGMPQIPDKD